MNNEELLAIAIEFDMGPEPIVWGRIGWEINNNEGRRYNVSVKNVGNPDGPDRWAIFKSGNACLNKDGEWEYQSMPSSRDDDFYERCRYASRDEAIAYYQRWKTAMVKWAVETAKTQKVVEYHQCPLELLKF